MMQEMVFQTCFQTLLTGNPEISQIAQQRLGQVLQTLEDDQQLSILKFFSHNGLLATFIGDGLQGSKALVEADLQKIVMCLSSRPSPHHIWKRTPACRPTPIAG